VVVEIDAFCLAAATVPPEDQTPLVVDADGVEPRRRTAQLLEVIAIEEAQRITQFYPAQARRSTTSAAISGMDF